MEELFDYYLEKNKEVGYITAISHSIAYISGLPKVKFGESIITESGKIGIVHGLNEDYIEALMIETENLKIKERVARTGDKFKIRVGEGLLERIINPLSQPLDNKGPITEIDAEKEIKRKAPGFIERIKINKPLETGVMAVDLLVPIGYGQRELVIGDAKTGKTTFILQSIFSQSKKGVICIYVGIGKRDIDIKKVEDYLTKQQAFSNTIIIHTTPDDSPTLIYLAPFSGMAIAEYFRDKGKNVFIIFDDLSTHAKIYREISLLLKRTPGRESYPGDIFHLHATLLERAGNINSPYGEVSITALPVAETLENDLSGYIQTNLIAITDGHIFFDSEEFKKGRRPAVNTFLSVSRVGNQTKSKIERELSSWLRKKMIQYRNALEISQFGAELPLETQSILRLGKKIETLLNQPPEKIIPRELQIILVGLLIAGFWKGANTEKMADDISRIYKAYSLHQIPEIKEVFEKIESIPQLVEIIKERIQPKLKNLIL